MVLGCDPKLPMVTIWLGRSVLILLFTDYSTMSFSYNEDLDSSISNDHGRILMSREITVVAGHP